jgi:lipopolysaccharide biosynthesis glycosyltransferase
MINPISIAFACDEDYSKHVAVVIQSILANAAMEDRHEFHILTMDLSSDAENRLLEIATRGNATLLIHQVDAKRLAGFPETRHTLNTYLRLLLPEILPDDDKILYLDADLMVFSSLQELWTFPIGANAVAAAIDSMAVLQGTALDHFKSLQLPKSHVYFNCGVLLLNLKILREIQLLEQVRTWTTEHSNLMVHGDQDVINVILSGKVAYFHLRWNLQVPLIDPVRFGWSFTQEQTDAVSNPAIIHYVTNRKSWLREFKLPYQSLYFKYLAQTPWKDEPLPPVTFDRFWQRGLEELDWIYKLGMSKVRKILGRYPKPPNSLGLIEFRE